MTQTLSADALRQFVTAIFEKAGLPEDDAAWTADTLVEAELRGVSSHGVIRIPNYVPRIENGWVNTQPKMKVEKDAGALALFDGDNGMGQVVARNAMAECIDRAETHNVGVVVVKNSNHFGAAALYAEMAAERGMVGLCTTNAIRVFPPHGGKEKLLGNNPIAIAIPGEPPIVLDMALSVVARGYIVQAARAGKPIPEGWGVDGAGNPTTDPKVVLEEGALSPISTYKGSGLSLVIDAILGAVAGGGHSHQVIGIMEDNGPSEVPHFLAALKIEALLPLPIFRAAVAAFTDLLRASPRTEGAEQIWMPGEIEWTQRRERLESGIPLPDERIQELRQIGERLGLPFPETAE